MLEHFWLTEKGGVIFSFYWIGKELNIVVLNESWNLIDLGKSFVPDPELL